MSAYYDNSIRKTFFILAKWNKWGRTFQYDYFGFEVQRSLFKLGGDYVWKNRRLQEWKGLKKKNV